MPAPIVHNDLPTLDDKLDWSNELDRLSLRIQGCDTPHVLGIHGDWGSGKTSFMRQLQWRLGGKMPDDGSFDNRNKLQHTAEQKLLQKKVITIWFDAWRYQNETMPVVALLHEMRRQMAVMPAVKEKFKKLGEISLRYTLNSLSDIGKIIGFEGMPSAEKLDKLGENWEKEHNAQALSTDTIRCHLQETIKCLLPKGDNARVVVFIDDLDRCNPKAAKRLLEGLKIYLSIPNCVFVLGMNERILVDAIHEDISAPKETPREELKLRAAHYLEKICTDIYRLSLPADSTILFSQWISGTEHRQALIAALGKIDCLPPNPRRLKALANQWERFAQYVTFPTTTGEQETWAVRVLVAASVHQFHRDMWERWHYNTNFWNEIKAWCLGERGNLQADNGNAINGTTLLKPEWAQSLKLNYQVNWNELSQPIQQPGFPNPGDIENFWIGALIYQHKDVLDPKGFEPLLKKQGA